VISFKKIRTADEVLNRVQDSFDQALKSITRQDALAKVVIEDVVLVAGGADNIVSHKLGRSVKGFLVVRKNAEADIWESPTTNNLPTKQIILRASAAVTVTLWFF
jgi:hypothetical protein